MSVLPAVNNILRCSHVCTTRCDGKKDGQSRYTRNNEVRSLNHCCCGHAIRTAYSECMSVDLVIQLARLIHRIILLSVACMAVKYFSTLSHRRHDLRRKKLLNTCVFLFSLELLCEIFLILRRIN